MHTLNVYMVTKNGKPFLVGGTPGADFQPQGNTQMITGIVDYGFTPQEIVDAPRWMSIPGTDPATMEQEYALQLEPRMPDDVARGLEAKGHKITWGQEGISHGIMQIIQIDPETGVRMAGSDPRGDGHAVAL